MAELMKEQKIAIADIYVPTKRRATLEPKKVEALAQDMLERGHQIAIMVRRDNDRFVLVEGLHRLEAWKSLGETTIKALLVQARRG
jgi:ParB-like chromosome segregation protein Spo0J